MRKTIIIGMLYCSLFISAQQSSNSLLNQMFWRNNPTIEDVKNEIQKGNNPAEENAMHMDVITLAINNNAQTGIIKYLLDQPGVLINKTGHEQRTYLHWATMKGNADIVDYLIKKGADINIEDEHDLSPLYLAINNGMCQKDIIELFFKAGLTPQQKYKDGANLLLISVPYDKDMSLTNYLVSKGISLQSTDNNGATAFDYAARKGNIDIMKALLKKGVKATPNALLLAAQGTRREANNVDVYRYLIDDLKMKPTVTDQAGNTLLELVVRKQNQDEVAAYLISKGVKVNATTPEGQTALMLAMANGSSSMVSLLLDEKADINAVDKKGFNLTYYLMQSYRPANGRGGMRNGAGQGQGRPDNGPARVNNGPEKDEFAEKFKILQNHQFNLIAPQKDGSTILHYAVTTGDLELVKKIVNMGVNLNAQNDDGMTALHTAASTAKDDKIIRFLVDAGADKTLKTSFDESAYDLVKDNEYLKKNNINLDFLK